MSASIVILISGRGSNMEAIIEAVDKGDIRGQVTAVISNRPEAVGLTFARERGIPAICIDHRQFQSREAFENALQSEIDRYQPRLVVLAGFMRILTEGFVSHYANRLLNIHPSLLPAFPGLDTHARALETGVKWHGCTVHFVTSDLDCGPIIIQGAVPVLPDDDEKRLAERVLKVEHHIYPKAVGWFMDGCLSVASNIVTVKSHQICQQFVLSRGDI